MVDWLLPEGAHELFLGIIKLLSYISASQQGLSQCFGFDEVPIQCDGGRGSNRVLSLAYSLNLKLLQFTKNLSRRLNK